MQEILAASLPGTEYTLKQNENTNGVKAMLEGYNVYRDGANIDYVSVPTTEYLDVALDPGTYEYCVSAVYDEGESVQICADPVLVPDQYPPGPINLTGPVAATSGSPVDLAWDAPGAPQWIRWDAGTNTGNGIGLTNGGTFSCAAHWYTDQLGDLNGSQILEVEFFANADPAATYVIKVWTGATGTNEVVSQDVPSFIVDDWNNVVIN